MFLARGKGLPDSPRLAELVKNPSETYWKHSIYKSRDIIHVLTIGFGATFYGTQISHFARSRPRRPIIRLDESISNGCHPFLLGELAV